MKMGFVAGPWTELLCAEDFEKMVLLLGNFVDKMGFI